MLKKGFREAVAFGIILLFFGTSILPSISGNSLSDKVIFFDVFAPLPDEQRDQYQTSVEGYIVYSADSSMMAQSFKPALNTLTRVRLKFFRDGDPPGDIEMSIRSSLRGNNLFSKNLSMSVLPPWEECWVDFEIPELIVIPEDTYYIIWKIGNYDWENCLSIGSDENDLYSRGMAYGCVDGSFWFPMDGSENIDLTFETYGYFEERAPVADAGGPYSGNVGDIIYLDASESYDNEGNIMGYRWDIQNDGVYDTDWLATPYLEINYNESFVGDVRVEVIDEAELTSADTSPISINGPPSIPDIVGADEGEINVEIFYNLTANDPEDNDIKFVIDWGDNITYETVYVASEETIRVSHSWAAEGDFNIRVKSVDMHDAESDWATLPVSVPRIPNKPWLSLLENIVEWLSESLAMFEWLFNLPVFAYLMPY